MKKKTTNLIFIGMSVFIIVLLMTDVNLTNLSLGNINDDDDSDDTVVIVVPDELYEW